MVSKCVSLSLYIYIYIYIYVINRRSSRFGIEVSTLRLDERYNLVPQGTALYGRKPPKPASLRDAGFAAPCGGAGSGFFFARVWLCEDLVID